VHAGGVSDHTVEVEQDGVVLVSGDRTLLSGCLVDRAAFVSLTVSSFLSLFA
jgi:hypothetical protein